MLRKFEPYFGDFLKKIQSDQKQKFYYKKKRVLPYYPAYKGPRI